MVYFLKSRSKAARGSSLEGLEGVDTGVDPVWRSNARRASKWRQVLLESFRETRSAIGLRHSKRLPVSKETQFLHTWRSWEHAGHCVSDVISNCPGNADPHDEHRTTSWNPGIIGARGCIRECDFPRFSRSSPRPSRNFPRARSI